MGEPKVLPLKPGRDKSVLRRHPWVFSGAVARAEGEPLPGDLVDVRGAGGAFLGRGYYNPASNIVVRLLTWDEEEVGPAFWRRRLAAAIARRERLAADPATTAYRLVYAESDGLPGLIVDRYGEWLVFQSLTLGMDALKGTLVAALAEVAAPRGIYERSDADVRAQEGLDPAAGLLHGEEPPERIEILENGLRYLVDVRTGHKTGAYLDQRENRRRAAPYCAGAEVLNAFSYTGGFGVYAAAAGARRVTNLDSSADALRLAEENLALNGAGAEVESIAGDAFQVLRRFRDQGRTFDVIVLDPPKFAFSRGQIDSATRGYKDINLLSMRLLRPGGTLCTFSCSGVVSEDLFQKVVFGASLDAGREVRILERLAQGTDHPVLLTFPEAAYLKGFVCRVE
jgi:23S rRNA (cytosine1962-C5)-methyltransferase